MQEVVEPPSPKFQEPPPAVVPAPTEQAVSEAADAIEIELPAELEAVETEPVKSEAVETETLEVPEFVIPDADSAETLQFPDVPLPEDDRTRGAGRRGRRI